MFDLKIEDESLWTGERYPRQHEVNRTARAADARGWNGTQFDLYLDGDWIGFLSPDEDYDDTDNGPARLREQ